jgi:hypothetical protein
MAKVAFTKLGLKLNKEVKTVVWGDQEIEIKQYLPVNEKLILISDILNACADDKKFYNEGKLAISFTIGVIENYSNISFTDKQKEDICKLFDVVVSSGLYEEIKSNIPNNELIWIEETLYSMIDHIYAYQNSVMGILDIISDDYKNLEFDASAIQAHLSDPENLTLLKSIVTKLG